MHAHTHTHTLSQTLEQKFWNPMWTSSCFMATRKRTKEVFCMAPLRLDCSWQCEGGTNMEFVLDSDKIGAYKSGFLANYSYSNATIGARFPACDWTAPGKQQSTGSLNTRFFLWMEAFWRIVQYVFKIFQQSCSSQTSTFASLLWDVKSLWLRPPTRHCQRPANCSVTVVNLQFGSIWYILWHNPSSSSLCSGSSPASKSKSIPPVSRRVWFHVLHSMAALESTSMMMAGWNKMKYWLNHYPLPIGSMYGIYTYLHLP